ncbi:hypothetical protein F4V89_27855 [Neorhizobium galegae]|nr:hypothetical protein F4V89_27855 [Neorhizobium galegae]
MNDNIAAAMRAVPSEAKQTIVSIRANWPLVLLCLAGVTAIIAFLNYEFSGLIASLAIGLGMVLFVAVTLIGGILSWLFFTGWTWRMSEARKPRRRVRRLADDDIPKRFWISGFGATLLWLLPLYALIIGMLSAAE